MKKIIISALLMLLLLVGVILALLFTQMGNNFLKPYIEKKILNSSNISVTIDTLTLKPSSIFLKAKVLENIDVDVDGKIDIFNLGFNLNYKLSANSLPQVSNISLDGSFLLAGSASGVFDDFILLGDGDIFGAKISFNTTLTNRMPSKIIANISDLKIAKVLSLLAKPIYGDGELFISANIAPNKNSELFGHANILLKNGVINKDVINKDLNLSIPKNYSFNTTANIDISNNTVLGALDFLSALGNVRVKNTTFDFKKQNSSGDFLIDIQNPQLLKFIAGYSLYDPVFVDGDFQISNTSLKVKANSENIAGGKVSINLDNDKLLMLLKGAKSDDLLKILDLPNYTNAQIDVNANITSLKDMSATVVLDIKDGKVNANVMKSALNITFPQDSSYSANSRIDISKDKANGFLNLKSSLGNLKIIDSKIDIKAQNIISDFELNSVNLSSIGTILETPLQGSFDAKGNFELSNSTQKVKVTSENIAGGKVDVNINDDKLTASLLKVKASQIFSIMKKDNYANADIEANIMLSSIKEKTGDINLNIKNGELNTGVINKEFNLTLPETNFNADTAIKMNKGIGTLESKILSSLANLEKFSGTFDANKLSADMDYLFNVKDLSKLNPITKQNMQGNVAVAGKVNYKENILYLNGKSNILGGNVDFELKNNKLVANGEKLSTLELFKMMNYPDIINALATIVFHYDILKASGDFKASMPHGEIVQNELNTLIAIVAKFDMTKEIYDVMYANGSIKGENIIFDFDMNSSKSSMKVKDGRVNGVNLNIPIALKIEHRDFNARVKGTTENPKVTLDSSDYLQEKATKEILKLFEKKKK